MDEELVAKVSDYERTDLDERHKVALRLADAYIIDMGRVSPELARQARWEFTDVELVDIGVMLFRASANKVRVALGTDHDEVRLRHLDED
jgi:hypothetical protein